MLKMCILLPPFGKWICPQICAETCAGRMRYVGVVLYDMDKVEEMAATKDEQEIYQNTVDLIFGPS